jgi:hypothetical protein
MNLLFRREPTTGVANRGLRDLLSLSRMLTVATAGLPMPAFDALLNDTVNVSVDSFVASSPTAMLKLFTVSPAAKMSVPEIAV